MNRIIRSLGAAVAGIAFTAAAAGAQEVNLYSSRHYSTDEALYENFTKATGIKVNRHRRQGRCPDRADQE